MNKDEILHLEKLKASVENFVGIPDFDLKWVSNTIDLTTGVKSILDITPEEFTYLSTVNICTIILLRELISEVKKLNEHLGGNKNETL